MKRVQEPAAMIDVLIVEDSQVVRDYLVYVLESDPAIRVIGTVASGEEALESVQRRLPHVILMDIHLPGMDGFETTRRIMSVAPVPIVVCTGSTSYSQVETAMRAVEAGALTALRKPAGLGCPEAEAESAELVSVVKLMSEVKVVRRWHRLTDTACAVLVPLSYDSTFRDVAVVAIGASTGGPPVVSQILAGLPLDFAVPILVVQHISSGFGAGFAEWLAATTRLNVHVPKGGETPLPGHVYLAPDDHHMRVGAKGELMVTKEEPWHGLRPSVGVLFRSVAERFGRRAIGVLLTGMGRDGADELKLMADRGALTVAQDEESCVVFGMPAEAIRLGAAHVVLPPKKIAALLAASVRPRAN